ncbi:tRNA1(Val) (adenine(37)-N6)-methyltransferase [Cohaesibacter celericrescens]|uniref:SAM-dependent methyltransferase n=1 Tax=Cohaesibacter celericrescens TaxID=2067669 RepID=A0A2N5XKP3_9HYPH|nr:methyltransferase [Cohaesibacter celericrescens]PLW75091.1 SAM-dependent methyltransferase [Cohaesibacter celericrescens]
MPLSPHPLATNAETLTQTHLPPALSLSEDEFLGGKICLYQPQKGHHRSGTDAVLLAACSPAKAGHLVVDLGSGVGAAGLCVAARVGGLNLVAVEIDKDIAAIAAANMKRCAHHLASATVLNCDVALRGEPRKQAGLTENMADHVIANPPYYRPEKFQTSPNEARATAHMLTHEGMDPWFRTAVSVLKTGGTFSLVQRADELPELLRLMQGRFGGITVQPFAAKEGEAAHRVVIQGKKQSRAPFRLLPTIVLHDRLSGKPSARSEAIHRHGAAVDLGL